MTFSAPLPTFKINVLIVDDQKLVAETVRKALADQTDITLTHCAEGSKAVETAKLLKPTVILQDIVMPDADGIEVVKLYRQEPETKDIPIIMLSGKEEGEVKAAAFAAGGNDYIVKLPSKLELVARIRYHSQNYIRLLERNEAYRRIEESELHMRQELNEAAAYVESLLPGPITDGLNVTSRFIPSEALGGDCFGYHWADGDNFAFYVLDVCGHGVGAALLSVTALNYLKTLPSEIVLNPKQVLKGLNDTFPMETHNNMFFSIWYGVFNKATRKLIFSNGGHPPAVLVRNKNLEELNTPGVVMGIEQNIDYQQAELDLLPGDQVFVFSDGVFELTKASGEMLDYHGFISTLANISPQDSLDTIVQFAYDWQGKKSFVDDFSLMRVML